MRNIFTFLWRSHFFILFLLFEVLCVYLIVQNNTYQRASFINSSNALSASIYSSVNDFSDYLSLKKTNEMLANENALLRMQLKAAFYENKYDTIHRKDTTLRQQYTYIPAKVINNSVGKRNNYLTLNKGSMHGIKPEMAVISSTGVVGIVKDVSEHFCSVLSLLHKDTRISAKLSKTAYFGSLVWQGGNPQYATLMDIPKHVQLKAGDLIVTSGFSSIFPENITVGTIEKFEIKPGDNFYTIKVLLSTNFNKINYVYVVSNLYKEEVKQLEDKAANDKSDINQ